MNGCLCGWMDGLVGRWMCVDGWMNGMDGLVDIRINNKQNIN